MVDVILRSIVITDGVFFGVWSVPRQGAGGPTALDPGVTDSWRTEALDRSGGCWGIIPVSSVIRGWRVILVLLIECVRRVTLMNAIGISRRVFAIHHIRSGKGIMFIAIV